jgi:CII-binding regulator of phage lambda lysogenization HflD
MLSPIKVQGGGENPLNLPQTVEVLTTKLNHLSKKIDNTNRTVMNLETHLDHLTSQDEYLNRRLSQCERDITHINNVLNQLPTFDQLESLITRTLAAQVGNVLPRMNNNEIITICEPSTIHPALPMSGNHDSDR